MKTKAAFFKNPGPPEVIEWGDIELPELQGHDVLVKAEAAAVDHIDTYIRSGTYQPTRTLLPAVVGRDLVGVVEKVGKDVVKFSPGQRVWSAAAGLNATQGATAEHVVVPEHLLYPAPRGVDSLELAAAIHAGMTACRGLIFAAVLRAGEIVFVNGAAGNVGSAMVQLAVARGARVIAATSGPEKIDWCKSLGADLVLDYNKDDMEAKVREIAPEGVQVYVDTSRNPDFDLAIKILALKGRILLLAGSDAPSPFPVRSFYRKELMMRGFSLNHATPEELAGYAEIINRCLFEKKLKAKIARRLPMSQARQAHTLVETTPELWGRIVLTA